ncbi:BREX-1 system adenine-specific DNA-methyltransferase PglX [Nocardia sp. NBC_00565]|uniref:BREX-1 system adenine-specific DNA-methyltransferase PglX n=1 Tax=Nocardia sp. NBC_00565 TaxID=2975993 RepID=UPI002E811935|nr:BREX-1 system adenine-specific DNA-methyltransferase PglX [Nocardia sp. NBC_00565]WUC04289.1 BREX-1 system adenine-specific DNA-methyltransferase PglX [Nocardia sp. NBC_00565]
METGPLKSFATWARTALIREVTARIAVVLAPASPERVEWPSTVTALQDAVKDAGGGDVGRNTVADKVAYTWFNRIVALRFMDAKGYTGIGVVSPEHGREVGQPEILAEAKRGNIDTTVVTDRRTVETVTSLLNGTRRSNDPQSEAYALLLGAYCRHWNSAMPFMFESEGGYSGLLMPANLLADDSVMAHAVSVLTTEVCKDVEVIGWLYQFYISERKDEIFAGFKRNNKAGAAEIPAATQLFTPHWIVRYLVENSLGRLWMLNRPDSRLAEQMEYYVAPVAEEADYLKIARPEELKVIDPACGSGHMLTYAFDLLYAIYEEEGHAPPDIPGLILSNNLFGTEIDPRAGGLAAFVLMMKARARQRTFFNKQIEPNICVLEPISFTPSELEILVTRGGNGAREEAFWNQFRQADTFGSLIRPDEDLIAMLKRHADAELTDNGDLLRNDLSARARKLVLQSEFLSSRYHIVVANPPYMGSGNMGPELAVRARREWPSSKADLFAMFIERSLCAVEDHGYVAMIAMQSWMFLSTFEEFRERLLRSSAILSMAHLGPGAFDTIGGEVVATTAFVLKRDTDSTVVGVYFRLVDVPAARKTSHFHEALHSHEPGITRFEVLPSEFGSVPGSPIAYWLSSATRKAFEGAIFLGEIASIREGINTGNNALFLRRWWEVSRSDISFNRTTNSEPSERWVPHKKGGGFRRWAGNEEYVLDWGSQGASIHAYHRVPLSTNGAPMRGKAHFFQPSLSWSRISTSDFSIREYPAGFSYDSTAPSIFTTERRLEMLLGLLNSVVVGHLLHAMSPTLDYRITALSRVPLPTRWEEIDLSSVRRLEELARSDWNDSETSWHFMRSPWIPEDRQPTRVSALWDRVLHARRELTAEVRSLEQENNRAFLDAYSLLDELDATVPERRVALGANARWRFPGVQDAKATRKLVVADAARDLCSYAVACMFGRYSIDEPGLILTNMAEENYLFQASGAAFMVDQDNVIPIVDGEWFEHDIVAQFRQFLRVAFGEQHFEENLRFVTESLGVKDLRDYFVKSFYKDHWQRYKKRPIYWLFSSPNGSFNALIYMHRYTPSTVSTVLNEYLREYMAKLEASRQHHERLADGTGTPRQKAAAQKEVDRLRKVLLELDQYEHDVLYPLATQRVQIDLDDGVKINYPKFGAALKKIPGLEASDE